ncbi:hypothetical protein BDR06DRAFT_1011235 [Suillus hirtellus]|nr:hypothetical protein BDR06DRAFT_1011235 [Suillus hirtellus]
MSNNQSAVGANGALLDTSDITWFHDADDDTPLPTSHMPLPPPAIMIAGSHRSAHVPHPASKLVDPNNAVLGKRKATGHQSDWVQLLLLREVLQEPANATQSFSSAKNPTVWRAIPVLEFLQQSWQNMADDEKFSSIADALQAGLENLGKWSHKMDEIDVYFICLGATKRGDQELKGEARE